MKIVSIILLCVANLLGASTIPPKSVAVLYNTQIPESKELAKFYAQMRNIPQANLIGLELSTKDEITRKEYNLTIRDPLRAVFIARKWWGMGKTPQGQTLPISSKITTLVCISGVPYKIKQANLKDPPPSKLPSHFATRNDAAVDSELTMLGLKEVPTPGPLNNPYFKKNTPVTNAKLPYMLLVGRIDAPSYAICRRMIADAIATEDRGLWGMCYIDLAKKGTKYALGDQWLESIAKLNHKIGIPTVVDRNTQTFPTNYPLNDAALYYGWYTTHKNGPLLNSNFKFRRGAVAIHIHSYSASQLRNASRHWVGPLLSKGAAATIGNVYEPYLQLSNHLDIFHDRLTQGYSLVEAAYMSSPVLSWQNLVLGDPLYRPFLHLDGSGKKETLDRDYRAIRMANQLWGKDPETMVKKLRTTAATNSNARLYEYLGLWHRAKQQKEVAIAFFQTASKKHIHYSDRLRQWLYTADIHRENGNRQHAIATLKKAQHVIGEIPETKSVTEILSILEPTAPSSSDKQNSK